MKNRWQTALVWAVGFSCVGSFFHGEGTNASPKTNAAPVEAASTPQPAPPITTPLKSDVNALIDVLQKKYVDPSQVESMKVDRFAVQGIVSALGPGAEILSDTLQSSASTNQPPPLRVETLAPMMGYVRLSTLDPSILKRLDGELARLDKERIDSLVLDLRFTKGGTFADATELVSKFLLKDKKLFVVQPAQSNEGTSYATTQSSAYIDWKVAVVINGETEGAAEAAAAALREQGRAIIVGMKSAGKAVLWSEETLPSGTKVRIATSKVVMADGKELFPKGVVPDVPIETTLASERKLLFELSQGKKMREFVEQEQTEKRLNEAALVKMLGKGGTNEPSEKMEQPMKKEGAAKPEEKKPLPPMDNALQRAVDILKGIRILHLD